MRMCSHVSKFLQGSFDIPCLIELINDYQSKITVTKKFGHFKKEPSFTEQITVVSLCSDCVKNRSMGSNLMNVLIRQHKK